MDDLVEWLRAQLDEDAGLAEAASPGPWHANAELDEVLAVDGITVADGFALSGRQLRATTEHIVAWDPARVLREIDAKRQVLSRYEAMAADVLVMTGVESILSEYRRVLLPNLALPYADRPGYREEWRP